MFRCFTRQYRAEGEKRNGNILLRGFALAMGAEF